MTLTEKAAYIKGLMDASELDKNGKEGKILAAVVDPFRLSFGPLPPYAGQL